MGQGNKYLILYASFGAGHQRAANAIREGLLTVNPDAQADVLDYFVFTNSTVYNLIRRAYLRSVRLAPGLWGRFYHRTSHISGSSPINKMLNKIGRRNFTDYLCLTEPDAVITTFPMPAGVLSDLKCRGLFTPPVITAITDFGMHGQWLHPRTDLYLAGAEYTKEKLLQKGISAENIFVSGIPVSPLFDEKPDKNALCKRLGLDQDVPTVLITGGAYGVMAGFKKTCCLLAQAPAKLQLLVVCGRDIKLYHELYKTIENPRNRVMIFPFVDNIHELMSAADLIVTKAGGLTVSEALVKRLPMVIFRPLPGVEEENTRYLASSGASLTVQKDADRLVDTILSLLNNPCRLKEMSAAAGRIRQANSAIRAAQRISGLVNETVISDFA